ncbi:MAG: twin-arginine translocation signal domain-containing protein, partial [Winogradskyella sp.]
MKRRKFLKNASLTGVGLAVGTAITSCNEQAEDKSIPEKENSESKAILPVVVATWHVEQATAKAMDTLNSGGTALDAVELGCKVEEANEKGQSVGKGGLPDREGNVTLDACIMDKHG